MCVGKVLVEHTWPENASETELYEFGGYILSDAAVSGIQLEVEAFSTTMKE